MGEGFDGTPPVGDAAVMNNSAARIVSLLPAATEIACALGLGERLVGVSHQCRWPREVAALPRVTWSRIDAAASSAGINSQVKALLASGEPLYEVDEELLIQLRPDVIITQSQCDVCAVSFEAVARLAAEQPGLAGSRVLTLNPKSLSDVLTDIEQIGAAVGATSAADSLCKSLRNRIEQVRNRAAGLSRRPRVAVIEWIEPLMIAGNWTPELVDTAGGEYGLAKFGEMSPYVSWGQLVEFAPDVVVIAPCGFDLNRSELEARQLEQFPEWQELPAVKQGQVSLVDGDAYFNCPGPRLVDSLEQLARFIGHCATA
jgi:iron complex transport system substrate-binding protein